MPRVKYTIADMRKLANSRGGDCLSEQYVNTVTKLDWLCKKGHKWSSTPRDVLSGYWCGACAGNKRLTLEDMHSVASERGGECLSQKYVNSSTKLLWKCASGHVWEATPRDIRHGKKWCPICAGNTKLTLSDLHGIAEKKGGKCLSSKYVNSKTKYLWECAEGHQWKAQAKHVKNTGSWCPSCAGNARLTLKNAQDFAKKNRGRLLSKSYKNNRTKLAFECAEGHKFKTTLDSNSWCPYCSQNKPMSLEDVKSFANSKGGKCLSTEYVHNKQNLHWECADGHQWFTSFHKVKNSGSWCPECAGSYTENKVRFTLETMFLDKFPTKKPVWLLNARGNRMELDGYCQIINLAFEYHGEQHTEVNYMMPSQTMLDQRIADDTTKRELCKQNNVSLIEIYSDEISLDIKNVILSKLDEIHFDYRRFQPFPKIDYRNFAQSVAKINDLRQIAKDRGGEILSNEYKGLHSRYKWRCVDGHVWEASGSNVKHNKSWCPECRKYNKSKA